MIYFNYFYKSIFKSKENTTFAGGDDREPKKTKITNMIICKINIYIFLYKFRLYFIFLVQIFIF